MQRTPLRKAIPEEMRQQLEADPFMQNCIVDTAECSGRIEWNHAFSYGGTRRNELWGILPMCHYHHDKESAHRGTIQVHLRYRLRQFSAVDYFKTEYPKSTLV